MLDGRPSVTAQRVASYRLTFDRVAAPYGHPEADEALARSVAGDIEFQASPNMERYLRVRTAFFDRVVVNAIERGNTQVVCIGAGYDGRALRYAHGSVHWFEVDHPSTSADKRARLDALDIDTGTTTFVAWDLAQPGLADALINAGFEPDGPTQFICEGVIVYLEPTVFDSLLREVRALATPGTRLALSLSVGASSEENRTRFQEAVAQMGEPVRGETTTPEAAVSSLGLTGWDPVDLSERSERAGLVMVRPSWRRPGKAPFTKGRIGRFIEDVLHREGTDRMAAHIEATYDRPVKKLTELDVGVFRVDFDSGLSWIARLAPPGRDPGGVRLDADLLRSLDTAGFPAERPAHPQAASELEGQGVLVTEMLTGRRPTTTPQLSRELGRLLAQLHDVRGPGTDRVGGAWHHLCPDGSVADELATARELMAAAAGRVRADDARSYERLAAALDDAADFAGLPTALVHADFVVANAIAGPGGRPAFFDWAGAGQGPRVVGLGCLLWGAAHKSTASVTSALAGYRDYVELEPAEVGAFEPAILRRPLVLAAWSFCTGRQTGAETARYLDQQVRMAAKAAAAATNAWAAG